MMIVPIRNMMSLVTWIIIIRPVTAFPQQHRPPHHRHRQGHDRPIITLSSRSQDKRLSRRRDGGYQTTTTATTTATTTTTALFGLRTRTKEKLSAIWRKRNHRRKEPSAEEEVENNKNNDDDGELMLSPITTTRRETTTRGGGTTRRADAMTRKQFNNDSDVSSSAVVFAKEATTTTTTTTTTPLSTATTTARRTINVTLPSKTTPFLSLPTLDPNVKHSKSSREFHEQLEYFAHHFSQRDVALLKSTRLRIVLQGMAAMTPQYEPAVYRAFQVLYQDLPPLRVTGRWIFRRLRQVLTTVSAQRRDEIATLVTNITMTTAATTASTFLPATMEQDLEMDLEMMQFAFLLWVEQATTSRLQNRQQKGNNQGHGHENDEDAGINNDREHDIILTTDMLLVGPCSDSLVELLLDRLKLETVQDLMSVLRFDEKGEIEFTDFVLALHRRIAELPGFSPATNSKSSDPTTSRLVHLQELLREISDMILVSDDYDGSPGAFWRSTGKNRQRILSASRQAHSDKFDGMLETFQKWKGRVPTGQGRRLDVLRGCFVGAQNEAIREALRICYVDVPAMRVAGNTIFALMSALLTDSPSEDDDDDNDE